MRFTVFTASDTPGLLSDNIRTMHAGSTAFSGSGPKAEASFNINAANSLLCPRRCPRTPTRCSPFTRIPRARSGSAPTAGCSELNAGQTHHGPVRGGPDGSVQCARSGPDRTANSGRGWREAWLRSKGSRLTEPRYASPRPVAQLEWDEANRLWTLYTSRRMGSVIDDSSQLVYTNAGRLPDHGLVRHARGPDLVRRVSTRALRRPGPRRHSAKGGRHTGAGQCAV